MPQIFELFGYSISDRDNHAEQSRKAALCPFMNTKCDGGGNRYQTRMRLNADKLLKEYFNDDLEVAFTFNTQTRVARAIIQV